MPFGTISQRMPNVSSTMRCASADTAVRIASRLSSACNGERSVSYQALRPSMAEWNVPTAGTVVPIRAAWLEPGENGSCRWSTSGPKLRIASSVRRATGRPAAIGATEPLLGTRVLGPTVVIPGSGGGPSQGAMMRASTPSSRSAWARPSTCPCTPPKTDSEYGQDSITRIGFTSLPRVNLDAGEVARPVGRSSPEIAVPGLNSRPMAFTTMRRPVP